MSRYHLLSDSLDRETSREPGTSVTSERLVESNDRCRRYGFRLLGQTNITYLFLFYFFFTRVCTGMSL